MSALDLLCRAEVSSDLAHHDHDCDVDTLGAAGMAAAQNFAHMAIFRIKYLNDAGEIGSAKRLFVMWARRAMINRNMSAASASRVGVQALTAWVNDVCPACNGLKYLVPAGTPALSDKQCHKCNGTGKNQIRSPGELGEVFKDLLERADSACVTIQRGIDEKLGRQK